MTLLVFFGCTFIAFGPSLAMFILTIAKYPLKIILLVVGAFFWLLSLLFSALLWLAVVPLKEQLAFSLVFSVMIQEAMRFALFKVMEKAENGLDDALTDEEKDSISHHKLSYTTGFGFGLMYGLFSIVNVLSQSIGPGSVGISGHSENFILISAFLTSCFILLHTFWNVIVFNAIKKKKYYWVLLVCGLHMLVSCFSLLNVQQNLSYVSLIISFCVLFFTTTWAFKVAGGSLVNIKACFNCNKF